jgi:ketosteroid isomerase-like protein
MWKYARTALLFAAIAAPASVAGQHMPGAAPLDLDRSRAEYTTAVIREYNLLMRDWRETLSDRTPDQTARFYADGALLLVSGETAALGREAIQGLFEEPLPQIVEMRTGLADFVASDNLAYATGPLMLIYRDRPGASVQTIQGHHVTVLVREGRRWRIRSQVLQYDADISG